MERSRNYCAWRWTQRTLVKSPACQSSYESRQLVATDYASITGSVDPNLGADWHAGVCRAAEKKLATDIGRALWSWCLAYEPLCARADCLEIGGAARIRAELPALFAQSPGVGGFSGQHLRQCLR